MNGCAKAKMLLKPTRREEYLNEELGIRVVACFIASSPSIKRGYSWKESLTDTRSMTPLRWTRGCRDGYVVGVGCCHTTYSSTCAVRNNHKNSFSFFKSVLQYTGMIVHSVAGPYCMMRVSTIVDDDDASS
jgi:hypothetical protein